MKQQVVTIPKSMFDNLGFMDDNLFLKMTQELERKLNKIEKEEIKHYQGRVLFIGNKPFSFLCNIEEAENKKMNKSVSDP